MLKKVVKNKKAVTKVYIVAFSVLFIALVAGLVMANTHTSNVSLDPEWSPANSSVDYTVNFCKNTGDTVNELRIYKDYRGSALYTNFQCDDKPGWEKLFIGTYPACFYVADPSSTDYNPLDVDGECVDFTFSAKTPSADPDHCNLEWKFETRDDKDYWKYLYDETSVDDKKPSMIKTVTGAQDLDKTGALCPNGPGLNEECWITQSTQIEINITEKGDCGISGLDYCKITYTVDGGSSITEIDDDLDGETSWIYTIDFDEDSLHELTVECMDIAGNVFTDVENFRVDDEPPKTTKTISDPKKVIIGTDGDIEWVDTATVITLDAVDPDPTTHGCNIGVKEIWWANTIVSDENCLYPESSDYCNPEGNAHMQKVDGNQVIIQKDTESCHLLQYYAIDELGNQELMQTNCFFVDKTAPEVIKDIDNSEIEVEINYDLSNSGSGIAEETSNEAYEGDGSIHLVAPLITSVTNEGRIVIPLSGMTLNDINTIAWMTKVTDGYIPHVDIILDTDGDNSKDDALVVEYDKAQAPSDQLVANMNFQRDVWVNTFDDKGIVDNNAKMWLSSGAPGPVGGTGFVYGSLADWKAGTVDASVNGDTKVLALEIEVDGWIVDSEAYIDLIKLNGATLIYHWVTPATEITFTCDDSWGGKAPHPAGDEELCFKVSYDLDVDGYNTNEYCNKYSSEGAYTEGDWCCVDASPEPNSPFVFNFNEDEDSIHDLEYFCRDAVEKQSPTYIQYYKVDSTTPSITKSMIGTDHLGYRNGTLEPLACPPDPNENDECYVRDANKNGVRIDVVDPDPTGMGCDVGVDYCAYELWWMTDQITCKDAGYRWDGTKCEVESGKFTNYQEIFFTEDSTHTLIVNCVDALGNAMIEDIEDFLVDSTPPETTKTYIPGAYIDDDNKWEYIDTVHKIELKATDAKVGVEEIRYRVSGALADKFCEPANCAGWLTALRPNMGPWNTYAAPFGIAEESCHVIEYSSIDKLGNEEPIQWQCVFVDKTKPTTTKTYRPAAYVDNNGWEYIDTVNDVVLSASDQGPHPSGIKETQYRVSGVLADNFCQDCTNWMTALRPNMGPWNTYTTPFKIPEESCHVIEYRSIDNVNKTEDIQWQCVFVDKTAPTITKTYNGPQYPTPIIANTPYPHYINSLTNVEITVDDDGPHKSGINKTEYRVTLLGSNEACEDDVRCQAIKTNGASWTDYTVPFTIPQDSCHLIEIYTEDNVGKSSTHRQCVFVDNKAPLVTKTITGPEMDAQSPVHKYLTEDSNINLKCSDQDPHPVGAEILNWKMYWKLDNCYVDDNWEAPITGRETDGEIDFTNLKDSCHKFVYWCEDRLGNVPSKYEEEIDIVDNQAPDPNKTVGEVKIPWTGLDSVFYDLDVFCQTPGNCWKVTMDTPISLDCNDPDPHPVNNEQTCFMVELDGTDTTAQYCNGVQGNYDINGDGYCCGLNAPYNFQFTEESEHNLKFYCVDALGNKGNIDDEKFKVFGKMFEIQLNKKWNLISVPFDPLDTDVDEVFKEVKSNIDSVITYDSANNHWYTYRPDGIGPNDLTQIKTGFGYWVMALDDDFLTVGGSLYQPGPMVPPSKELVMGWNLIGYYGTEGLSGYYGPNGNGKNAYCALYSLRNLDSMIPSSNWNALLSYWEPQNPNQWDVPDPNKFQLYDEMDPGAGYWIAMDEVDTYNPQTVCEGGIVNTIFNII